jgi:hypothetical protein
VKCVDHGNLAFAFWSLPGVGLVRKVFGHMVIEAHLVASFLAFAVCVCHAGEWGTGRGDGEGDKDAEQERRPRAALGTG